MCSVDELFDVGLGVAFIWVIHANVHWAVLVFAGQGQDGARHGCREHQGLAKWWGESEQALNVWQESEVKHFIRLIEHHESDLAEVQLLLLRKVD